MTAASAPREYQVCVKLVDGKAGCEDKVVCLPKITVVEGQPGTCTVCTKSGTGRMRVQVDRIDTGKVSVGIRLSETQCLS